MFGEGGEEGERDGEEGPHAEGVAEGGRAVGGGWRGGEEGERCECCEELVEEGAG